MNDHQLLCFLTVARTLNFSGAARELYCTQPALSYQIRSLEKELDVELFQRSTTQVTLTDAGRALLPCAKEMLRQGALARTAIKPFVRKKRLVLRLPPVLLQRDAIYPIFMAKLHAAFPEYELQVCTDPVSGSLHHLLSSEADAVLTIPFTPVQEEVLATPLLHTQCYLIAAPAHPLAAKETLVLADLEQQNLSYEPIYDTFVQWLISQPGMPLLAPSWTVVESYERVYAELLAGQCLFISPIRYPHFPASWYHPLDVPIPFPDTCLLTLRDDPRPQIPQLRKIFTETYHTFFKETGVFPTSQKTFPK